MIYKHKYIKYKHKYIQLKYQIGGNINKYKVNNVEQKLKKIILNNDTKNIYKLIKKYSPQNNASKKKSIDDMLYFRDTFSYAVPNRKIIKRIKKFIRHGKVLEVGAGKGLWASLLDKEEVDIIATDNLSWELGEVYTQVKKLDAINAIKKYNDSDILMMIWPPLNNMSYNGLKKFNGKKLIYIGEQVGGCTACDKFFKELSKKWNLVQTIDIPNWYGLSDKVYLYKRQI